jgi:hypothetical protein
MSSESEESTIIQSGVMRIAHMKAFRSLKIGLTGTATSIIQMTVKMMGQARMALVMVSAMEIRRNMGVKEK